MRCSELLRLSRRLLAQPPRVAELGGVRRRSRFLSTEHHNPMNTHIVLAAAVAATAIHAHAADTDASGFTEHMTALVERGGSPRKLKGSETATTKASFKPPVEIIVEAKTDSSNLRLSYAANELIFNWEGRRTELRVGGGPANGQHKPGAGQIPTNKYVTIRWVVTPKSQTIYVDGQLRYEHKGDYSTINNPVSVFPSHGSEVTVKTIKVKQLPPGTE